MLCRTTRCLPLAELFAGKKERGIWRASLGAVRRWRPALRHGSDRVNRSGRFQRVFAFCRIFGLGLGKVPDLSWRTQLGDAMVPLLAAGAPVGAGR
jgi:hypothetical protein